MTGLLRMILIALAVTFGPAAATAASISFTFQNLPKFLDDGVFSGETTRELSSTPLAEAVGQEVFNLQTTLFSFGASEGSATLVNRGTMTLSNTLDAALTLLFDARLFTSASFDLGGQTGAARADVNLRNILPEVPILSANAFVSAPGSNVNSQTDARQFEVILPAESSARFDLDTFLAVNTGSAPDAVQSIVEARVTLLSATGFPSPLPEPEPSVIPLPASGVLLLGALGGLAMLRHRRARVD